jgi:uncharacterized protein (DUF427 family)
MRATWNGAVIAESNETVIVEGNHYFPAEALKREFVVESAHRTTCPWKGTAHYYTLQVNGAENRDAVWYYPTPKAGAEQVAGRVAFWKGVQVSA